MRVEENPCSLTSAIKHDAIALTPITQYVSRKSIIVKDTIILRIALSGKLSSLFASLLLATLTVDSLSKEVVCMHQSSTTGRRENLVAHTIA